MKLPMKLTPRHVGALLAAIAVISVLVNQRDLGSARDETVYMTAGARYAEWWGGLVTFRGGDCDLPWPG